MEYTVTGVSDNEEADDNRKSGEWLLVRLVE